MNVPDIYFEPAYGKLCELIQGGSADDFVWESPSGTIRNMFIRRPLPEALDPSGTYTDLATPYGYGGPVIVSLTGDRATLVREYDEAFSAYCRSQNIVCEFVRFHPLLHNVDDFTDVYDTQFMRPTVATPLRGVSDVLMEQFSKSARKTTRRALRQDIHVEYVTEPDDLSLFMEVYYDTMDRQEAAEDYYFPQSYFCALCEHLGTHLLNIRVRNDEDVCIASGLYFVYGDFMHAHLSGTRHEYLNLSPAYVLKYASVEWARKHGLAWVHYGGGTTNDPEDSLLAFKKKFSKGDLLDFYVGRKIFMPDVYQSLVRRHGVHNDDFFPEYRA
jgi:hypothetical protein